MHASEHAVCTLVSWTEHAPRQSQRLAEGLLRLRLLAATRERARQVGRREQRVFVLWAEQAGRVDEDITLDLRSLGALALPCDRARHVGGRDERIAVASTENAPPLLQRTSAECLRFCALSQAVQRGGEDVLCEKRALVVDPGSMGPRSERRPHERRRIRALPEAQKRESEVAFRVAGCSGPSTRVATSRMPRCSRTASACSPAASSTAAYEHITERRSRFVSAARACFVHSAIASRIWTRPVNRCLHVAQQSQGPKVSSGGVDACAASAILTRHAA